MTKDNQDDHDLLTNIEASKERPDFTGRAKELRDMLYRGTSEDGKCRYDPLAHVIILASALEAAYREGVEASAKVAETPISEYTSEIAFARNIAKSIRALAAPRSEASPQVVNNPPKNVMFLTDDQLAPDCFDPAPREKA